VIEACKTHFPNIAKELSGNPRVSVQVMDGVKHIHENKGAYDVIMVDSTEPVGPAVGLFEKGFYQGIYDALKPDGIMVAQTESPWFNRDLIKRVFRDLKSIFPITRLYTVSIPTYPSGLWSFTIASKQYDPLEVDPDTIKDLDTKYYSPELHHAVFKLPKFVQELTRD